MSLDLNTISGFNSLVGGAVGGASSLLTSLTGAINAQWDIQEGSYGHNGNQVLFHVFKTATNFDAALDNVQDTGGHRKIPIVFPYQDGQSTDDLGRQGEVYDFNILIFGANYKAQYQKLLAEFDNPIPGTLIHPVNGRVTVAAESWIVTHSSDKKQAVALRVRFIEHSFSITYGSATAASASTLTSALTSAVSFIGGIAASIANAQSLEFVAKNTINLVASLLSGYQTGYTATLTQINQAFNTNASGAAATIPGLAPTVPGQDPTVFGVASSPATVSSSTAGGTNVFAGTGSITASQTAQSQQLTAALASQQAVDAVSALMASLNTAIGQIEATESGQGALIFYDTILTLKQSAVSIQAALEQGLQTSSNTVITYQTPRDMSVREVCFANGLTPDDSYSIEVLNPLLLSLNLIPKGTVLQVPT